MKRHLWLIYIDMFLMVMTCAVTNLVLGRFAIGWPWSLRELLIDQATKRTTR